MIHRLSLLLLVLACFAISIPRISAHTSTSDTTTSHISNFRYVQINIIDTSNTTTNTFLPQLNGTIINLAENDMCTTPVFAAACNRTNNVGLLLRSTGSGTGTTKDISVLSIFQCISIWGPSRCTYDDGYTRVTYNQPQSARPDTYTVHVLTQHFGCPCSRLIPNNTNTVPKTVTITSILLAPTFDFITVRFSAPIAASQLHINTSVPLNTLLTSAGITRLGTGATARWIDSTTLVFRLGTNPSLSDDLGLLPGIFSVVNYPDVSVTTYPLLSTTDGFPIRFDVTVRDEVHPDVFCSNIVFTITGLWSRNRSDIILHVMRGNTPITNLNYTLTPGNNTDVTLLTLPSNTWQTGTYSIHLAVPSPLYGTRQYMKTIDVWRLGSCECTSARPEYYECRDCANPATPCLNNGTCTINPALNVTSMSPANATSRSTCTKCNNGYYGAACQFPPPCGLNNTNSSIAAVCGPHGLTCTNSADATPIAICTCEQDWSGAKCTIMSEAWTYVTIRLLYNYSSITNQTQFSNAFANEMGTALKRNPALFVVKSLRPGSTIVEFGIQPDRNNSVPSRAIYNQFMALFRSNSTNGTFSGPILSTLDRSFLPIVIHDCNADGCTSAVPASGPSTDDDDWKLGVGLGVGLGGACLLLTCLFLLCRRRPEETTTTKEVAYPSSVPMTTPAPVAAAAPIPVTTIKQVDVPADTAHHTHDEEKAHGEQTAEGAEKRTVVFHV